MRGHIEFKNGRDELYTYHYVSGDDRIVEIHWPGLYTEWTSDINPNSELNINSGRCEEAAVYLGLLWRLTEGTNRYGIPNFYRDKAESEVGTAFDFIRWEYDVKADDEPGKAIDNGFVPARASVTFQPPPSEYDLAHQEEAGLFEIRRFRNLVSLQSATLCDASSEISLFGINSQRKEELLNFLKGDQRPCLNAFLQSGDIFIDLVVGNDMGYYDSILIKSTVDISISLEKLVHEYEQAILDYERIAPHLVSMQEALDAMKRLAQGQRQGQH